MYSRSLVVSLILLNLFTVGLVVYMESSAPRTIKQTSQIARNSYFIACMGAMRSAGYPHEYHLDVCKQESLLYFLELSNAVGENVVADDAD